MEWRSGDLAKPLSSGPIYTLSIYNTLLKTSSSWLATQRVDSRRLFGGGDTFVSDDSLISDCAVSL